MLSVLWVYLAMVRNWNCVVVEMYLGLCSCVGAGMICWIDVELRFDNLECV